LSLLNLDQAKSTGCRIPVAMPDSSFHARCLHSHQYRLPPTSATVSCGRFLMAAGAAQISPQLRLLLPWD
jgi:hypothetical protein